jgi:hypothetical protein
MVCNTKIVFIKIASRRDSRLTTRIQICVHRLVAHKRAIGNGYATENIKEHTGQKTATLYAGTKNRFGALSSKGIAHAVRRF